MTDEIKAAEDALATAVQRRTLAEAEAKAARNGVIEAERRLKRARGAEMGTNEGLSASEVQARSRERRRAAYSLSQKGLSRQEIASQLGLSLQTVRSAVLHGEREERNGRMV